MAALPSVDYPTIQVYAALPGASPETMASTVATPLEAAVLHHRGIQQMSSVNSQGTTTITVQFNLSRNIDAAAQDMQAAISAAGGLLPTNMPRPPTYQKVNPAEQPIYYLALTSDTCRCTSDEYAERCWRSASRWSAAFRSVQVFGEQKYAVRVEVDRTTGGVRHRHRRSPEGHRSATPTCPPALDGDKQAFTVNPPAS